MRACATGPRRPGERDHRRAVARRHVPPGEPQPVARRQRHVDVRPPEVGALDRRARLVVDDDREADRQDDEEPAKTARRRRSASGAGSVAAAARRRRERHRTAAPSPSSTTPATPASSAVRSSPLSRSTATWRMPSTTPATIISGAGRQRGGRARSGAQPRVDERQQGGQRDRHEPAGQVVADRRAGLAVPERVVEHPQRRRRPSRARNASVSARGGRPPQPVRARSGGGTDEDLRHSGAPRRA